ncbi:hypothetical protein DFH11DRAFT_1728625 [Phellopilus nigrolimitatus]|nr:hypothetical protein DFH11DRAFT_1728625 [Phellopilus nigrolimitatus]
MPLAHTALPMASPRQPAVVVRRARNKRTGTFVPSGVHCTARALRVHTRHGTASPSSPPTTPPHTRARASPAHPCPFPPPPPRAPIVPPTDRDAHLFRAPRPRFLENEKGAPFLPARFSYRSLSPPPRPARSPGPPRTHRPILGLPSARALHGKSLVNFLFLAAHTHAPTHDPKPDSQMEASNRLRWQSPASNRAPPTKLNFAAHVKKKKEDCCAMQHITTHPPSRFSLPHTDTPGAGNGSGTQQRRSPAAS